MFLAKISIIFSLLKGGEYAMSVMVDVYVTLIVAGVKNITQVPTQLREAVLGNLSAMGLDGYGKPLQPPTTP